MSALALSWIATTTIACSGDDDDDAPDATIRLDGSPNLDGGTSDAAPGTDAAPATDGAVDGPTDAGEPVRHQTGTATSGLQVFRFETFGNEGFWTDAARLPQGIVAAQLTPVQALQAGMSVDVDALPAATQMAVAAELAAMGTSGPLLNSFATTVALLNANAVIGAVVKDTNGDGVLNVAAGDKVGVSCAFCHSITDKSVASLPTGGSIGKRIDGPTPQNLNVGAVFALAANTRALYPMAQLKGADGTSIGRAPSAMGLTRDSTEQQFDAYFGNPDFYPIGMFDDTLDGNGNPMHIVPFFRTDLAAPWGTAGEFARLDQFNNVVFSALLDPTTILTPGGRTFLDVVAPMAGDRMAEDYAAVLAATGVTNHPYVRNSTAANITVTTPGDPDGAFGFRVDDRKLLDLNAYTDSLPAPAGDMTDPAAIARGRELFRGSAGCTSCHNVDQTKFVPPFVLPMATVFPGDEPTILIQRMAPLVPIQNTPGSTFDDKTIVINASVRGDVRGIAMPLLLDLKSKNALLHDHSVTSLNLLLSATRTATAPHPFFVPEADMADLAAFLKSL